MLLGAALMPAGAGAAGAHLTTDTTPPVISGAGDITVPATSDCYQTFCATVTWPFTVSDPDDPPDQITVACNNPNGQTYLWGQTHTTCQAHDPAGNLSAPVAFNVYVTVPPPTFQSVPGPLTYPATGPAGGPATFATPTAVDVGGQAVPVTCDHQSGIVYPLGTTTVTCTAQIERKDSNGTPIGGLPSATTQFTITITAPSSGGGSGGGSGGSGGSGGGTGGGTPPPAGTPPPPGDSTAPVLQPHPNVRVNATRPRGADVLFAVSATDPDDQATQLTVTCMPGSGTVFPLGARATTRTTIVTCRARDAAGNQSAASTFAVTVLGAHDQLVSLERQVAAVRALTAVNRVGLVSILQRADTLVRRNARGRADGMLATFVEAAERSHASRVNRSRWVTAAARIITVLG